MGGEWVSSVHLLPILPHKFQVLLGEVDGWAYVPDLLHGHVRSDGHVPVALRDIVIQHPGEEAQYLIQAW